MQRPRCGSLTSRAFTLVEALVAMAVLSAGVIGVVEVFSLATSTASRNERLSQAVQIAQRELSMAMISQVRPKEGASFPHRWKVQRQERPMGMELVAVTVSWSDRGAEQNYRLEQLCLARPKAPQN